MTEEGLSFIIATRWASEILEICLKSIIEGSVFKNQIIIIADRPSWQTLKLLQEDFKMIYGRDYWIVDFGHLDRTLDYGVQFAKKDYICTTMDDIVFAKGWDEEIMKTLDGKKDRIVSSAYYHGNNNKGINYKDLGYPKLKYVKREKDTGKGFNWEDLNPWIPTPIRYVDFCKTNPILVLHKDLYKRVNGLTYFSPQGQAHEFDLVLRAERLGFKQVITPKTIFYHFGSFANSDGQQSALRKSKGYFKCNVCNHIDPSIGNDEHPHTDNAGKWISTERGKIALSTGLYLCDRCKQDGWIINMEECKVERRNK